MNNPNWPLYWPQHAWLILIRSVEMHKMSLVRYFVLRRYNLKRPRNWSKSSKSFLDRLSVWINSELESFVQTTIEWDGNTLVETQTWGNPPKSTTIRWSAEGDKMTAVSSSHAIHLRTRFDPHISYRYEYIFQYIFRLSIWKELFANDSMSALQNEILIDAADCNIEMKLYCKSLAVEDFNFSN